MVKIAWHVPTVRRYEAGVDRGVLYPSVGPGIGWSGLISVEELSSGADISRKYINGLPYHQRRQVDDFSATITAFAPPNILAELNGFSSPNGRPKPFGLSYRVGSDQGYKIHLVYNALIRDRGNTRNSVSGDAEPGLFSWGLTTRPIPVGPTAATAHLIIDAQVAHDPAVAAIEERLYGSDFADPELPSPAEVLEIFESNSILRIIDNGDGTWTAVGPDSAIQMLDPTTFEISWPSAVYISNDTYIIRSL